MILKDEEGYPTGTWEGRPWKVVEHGLLTAESPDLLPHAEKAGVALNNLRAGLRVVRGVFMPSSSTTDRIWDLANEDDVGAFVRDALRVSVKNPSKVIDFVNRWGVLGTSGEALFGQAALDVIKTFPGANSMAATCEALSKAQAAAQQLDALKRRRAPSEAAWREWAAGLEEWLFSVRPSIRWDPVKGPKPAWTVERPVDLLWITLWDWATRGGRLRRCEHCDGWFPTRDPRKRYCATVCTNRASAAAFYDRQRRAKQRRGATA